MWIGCAVYCTPTLPGHAASTVAPRQPFKLQVYRLQLYRGLACRPVSVHSVAELAVPCCTNGVFGSKVQRVRISDRSSSDLHATDDLRLIINTSVQASTQNPKITEKYRRKKIPNKSPTSDNKERTKGAHAALSSYRRHTAVCARDIKMCM